MHPRSVHCSPASAPPTSTTATRANFPSSPPAPTVLGDGVLALAPAGAERPNVVFCQLAPWQFDPAKSSNLKRTFRRSSFLLTRLMGNMGVAARTPLLERFLQPTNGAAEARWKEGLYLDTPEEWDDPYRFFRW